MFLKTILLKLRSAFLNLNSARFNRRILAMILLLSGLILTIPVNSKGLVIESTRIIFPLNQREISVGITNSNDYPIVVQLWVDAGNIHADLDSDALPVVILPPLVKLKPNEMQRIRLMLVDSSSLPQQKESILWFNAQEIAPQYNADQAKNRLNISLTNRLKLFLRPASLIHADSSDWLNKIQCKAVKEPATEATQVICHNPTAYYVTLSQIYLKTGLKIQTGKGALLAPDERQKFSLTASALTQNSTLKSGLTITVIGDDGYRQQITPQTYSTN